MPQYMQDTEDTGYRTSSQAALADALLRAVEGRIIEQYDDGTVSLEIGYNSFIEATPAGRNEWDLAIRGYSRDHGMDYEQELTTRSLSLNGVVRKINDLLTEMAGEW